MLNNDRWITIYNYAFDDFNACGFSSRLAKENNWTERFTELAIAEYKKFMYLASISDQMVAPSPIIDHVWHQHLIYTKSYSEFCHLLGKQVQHIPTTHSGEEVQKFRAARERTRQLYSEYFGQRPGNIWEESDMFGSLGLPKANFKIRSFLIVALLTCLIAIMPLYWLLLPLYAHINNPYFLIVYGIIAAVILLIVWLKNRISLLSLSDTINKSNGFVKTLTPLELIYIEKGKIEVVIHGLVNNLIVQGKLSVYSERTIIRTAGATAASKWEYVILMLIPEDYPINYSDLVKRLSNKEPFINIVNCMDAFRKYVLKSSYFFKLFTRNFYLLVGTWLLEVVRLLTGLARNKPVDLIFITVLVGGILIVLFLYKLSLMFFRKILPKQMKREQSFINDEYNSWDWEYFLFGSAVFLPEFKSLAGIKITGANSGGDVSAGCSAGSTCGSSCSSCGGCGGD